MTRKLFKAEVIVNKLREAYVLLSIDPRALRTVDHRTSPIETKCFFSRLTFRAPTCPVPYPS